MGDVIWQRMLLVDTCRQGGTEGRLAERRLVLNQPVEEMGGHVCQADVVMDFYA